MIPKEIRKKVASQYFGCDVVFIKNVTILKEDGHVDNLVLEGIILTLDEKIIDYVESFQLLLYAPDYITDEHAIDVAKIYNSSDISTHTPEVGKACIFGGYTISAESLSLLPTKISMVAQYLFSKAYDIPNFHLNGNTPIEVGLAKLLIPMKITIKTKTNVSRSTKRRTKSKAKK